MIKSGEDAAEPEKEIHFQNKEYYRVYDYIAENVSKRRQTQILKFNQQMIPAADEQVISYLCVRLRIEYLKLFFNSIIC